MSDIKAAVLTYCVLLAIVMYTNYGISKMNERYDKSNKMYKGD